MVIRSLIVFLFVFCMGSKMTRGQKELEVINSKWLKYSDSPNALYHHLTGEAFRLLGERSEKVSRLTTLEEWKERQSYVRRTLWEIMGPFPEKGKLNARITGKVKKKGYSIENVIYESLPGFYVTASLFIPDKVKKPAPGILFCSGHSHDAYRLESYQIPLLNLVMKGFIVLAFDPIGQGERLQYFDPVTSKSTIGSSTKEHSYPSVQVFLAGKSIARYFAWDGIRGIDYLVSRKEVDPQRIGVHGLSGGGTQTAYISALDERVTAAAPACYITSYQRLMESIGVQDGEQNLYHGLFMGLDHADYVEVRAPKPTLIMATTNDFFSIQGVRETFAEAAEIYNLYGEPGNIEITEDDYQHGYTRKNREAMYAFFQKHLGLPGSPAEEEVNFPEPKELQKTSTGQLAASDGGETVFSLNLKEVQQQIGKLQESRRNPAVHLQTAVNEARKLSGYRDPANNDKPVFTGRIPMNGYVIEKYFLKGEGDYAVPYLLLIPERKNGKAVVYIHPSGKSAEASPGGEMEWFVNQGFTLLAPDLAGLGETGPGIFKGDANIESISYNNWFNGVITRHSIVGVRAADVNKLARILKDYYRFNEVFGVARREMAPVLLHAAAFDPAFSRVALIEPFSSYRSVVVNRYYKPFFVSGMVAGALNAYDLPDLAASIAPRPLLITGMTDANGLKPNPGESTLDTRIIEESFRAKNASSSLSIIPEVQAGKFEELFGRWIN